MVNQPNQFANSKKVIFSPNLQKSISVLLNENFSFSRPLTVTGACFLPARTIDGVFNNEEVFFHQMTLDRIENGEYVLQNNEISVDAPGMFF